MTDSENDPTPVFRSTHNVTNTGWKIYPDTINTGTIAPGTVTVTGAFLTPQFIAPDTDEDDDPPPVPA